MRYSSKFRSPFFLTLGFFLVVCFFVWFLFCLFVLFLGGFLVLVFSLVCCFYSTVQELFVLLHGICLGTLPCRGWSVIETKGCFSLERHLPCVVLFNFSQAVTPPVHVADVLGCTLHSLLLWSQDKSGAKDTVLKVSAVSHHQVLARVVPTACRCWSLADISSYWRHSWSKDFKVFFFLFAVRGLCPGSLASLCVFTSWIFWTLFHSKMPSLKLRAWFAADMYLFQSSKSGSCDWSGCLSTPLCLVQVRTRAQCCSFLHQLLICVEEHLNWAGSLELYGHVKCDAKARSGSTHCLYQGCPRDWS